MYLLNALVPFLLVIAHVSAAPASKEKRQGCANKLQRRAWHTLSSSEKVDYLNAERCLMFNRPALTGAEGAFSRFDDLIGAHQNLAGWVHNTGWFLPWHRLHMLAHERLLREECGYRGAQPYWDEARDAGRFSSSEIFDAQEGFGGNGVDRGDDRPGCVMDGPFAGYKLHQGPGYLHIEHCISRSINDDITDAVNQNEINECLRQPNFENAWPCIEANPHAAGHRGVGGVMENAVSSPGDPLFYLHHTFLDRVWWQWQELDLSSRLQDISGSVTGSEGGLVPVTLDDELDMRGIIPNTKIRDLMDIGDPPLCYEYI